MYQKGNVNKTMKKIILFSIILLGGVILSLSVSAALFQIQSGKLTIQSGKILIGNAVEYFAPQWLQTKDDWVASGLTTNEYILEEATWSAVSGSPFAGYDSIDYSTSSALYDLYSGIVKQDTRTGLWWSDVMALDGGGTATTTSNGFTLSADGVRPTGGGAIGFCDALNTANFAGYSNWYLPTQKELQQAYIDGSANNLDRPAYLFWSSSELSWASPNAWTVNLSSGSAGSPTKVTKDYVRCVRR